MQTVILSSQTRLTARSTNCLTSLLSKLNPIVSINKNYDSCNFSCSKLALLNLQNAKLSTWDEIDRLAKFPALTNLRTQHWPLWDKCESTEHERRQLLIARLPNVQILNGGGVVGSVEREDAERAFIRYYLDKPESDRPDR